MEDFQPSRMSNGLKSYLSKSSQKNDPSNFKEQRIKPFGIAQILLSLLGMCIMLFASSYSSTNIYISFAIMFVIAIIVIGITLINLNTYVMITRSFVETCTFKGHKNKIEYKNITGYNVYDDGYETGIVLQGSGKIVNNGRDINSVQASSVCANLAYLRTTRNYFSTTLTRAGRKKCACPAAEPSFPMRRTTLHLCTNSSGCIKRVLMMNKELEMQLYSSSRLF